MVRGQWGNLAMGKFGIINDHKESGPRFNLR